MTPRRRLDPRKIGMRTLGCKSFCTEWLSSLTLPLYMYSPHTFSSVAKHSSSGTLGLSAFLTILSDPRVQNIPLILETPTFEAVEVWECEIKLLNALSEIGAGSGAKGERDTGREEMLKEMLDDLRSVIREYRDPKDKVSKRSKSGDNSKAGAEEEDDETGSDESCTEH